MFRRSRGRIGLAGEQKSLSPKEKTEASNNIGTERLFFAKM